MATETAPTIADVEAARGRLEAAGVRSTPVYESETFTRRTGREVLLKAENLQRTGAFKIRGAVNRIATLSDAERAAGVVAASAGNHGQAVAWAARAAGVDATIFMPEETPMAKIDATRNYGGRVELIGVGFEEALAAAREYAEEAGATFVHAFEDPDVIAGQGTIGLELAEQLPEGRDGGDPDRRRRARIGYRARAEGDPAGGQARRCSGRCLRALCGQDRARLHDRRRNCGQGAG